MKSRIALLSTLLFVPIALATEPAEVSRKTPPVLALAPDDALAIVYFAKPADIFENPVWVSEFTRTPQMIAMLKAAAATFDGPVMIAVSGSPLNPLSLRVEFAIKPAQGADAFYEKLGSALMPMVAKIDGCAPGAVDATGEMRTIRLPGPMPLTLLSAVKDGVIYGSSQPTDVNAWRAGETLDSRFIDGDDAAKLPDSAFADCDAFTYVNLRMVMPMLAAERDRELPGLFTAFGYDRIEFGAVALDWSHGSTSAMATFSWAGGNTGMFDLLTAHNAPLEITSLFPKDYTFYVRGAWTSAADWVDRVDDVLSAFDDDIVDEFREECGEFRRDYGFDPVDDFAGNFVDEWAVGARFNRDGSRSTLAAFELAQPAVFEAHMRTLIDAFDLANETSICGDTLVYSVPASQGIKLAWATQGNYWLVANGREAICDAVANESDASISAPPAVRDVQRQMVGDPAQVVYVNFAQLAQLALDIAGEDREVVQMKELLEKVAGSNAGVAVAISRDAGVLTAQVATSGAVDGDMRQLAWKSLTASLSRSRMMAKRAVSASNLKGIVYGCMVYADGHKNAWPTSLGELIEQGILQPASFRAPYDDANEEITPQNVDYAASYVYRDGTGLDPSQVVLCERSLRDGGANFAFADGHVEWIEGSRAEELLAQMHQSAVR